MKVKLLRPHSKDCQSALWWYVGEIRLDAIGRAPVGVGRVWLQWSCVHPCNALIAIREDSIVEAAQKALEEK